MDAPKKVRIPRFQSLNGNNIPNEEPKFHRNKISLGLYKLLLNARDRIQYRVRSVINVEIIAKREIFRARRKCENNVQGMQSVSRAAA